MFLERAKQIKFSQGSLFDLAQKSHRDLVTPGWCQMVIDGSNDYVGKRNRDFMRREFLFLQQLKSLGEAEKLHHSFIKNIDNPFYYLSGEILAGLKT